MQKNNWAIKNVKIANRVVVAPMAGISNIAFRSICKTFQAGLLYSEMISDKALFYENEKTLSMLDVKADEHPIALQIFGHDENTMVNAAKMLDTQSNCDIIDINLGCPVNKIIKSHAGSALMRDPKQAIKICEAIVKQVKKPVCVKMRLGWDHHSINCIELAQALQGVGISAIVLHARTRKQMYEGKADWSYIAKMRKAIQIPLIGNGDIKSGEDAKKMLDETGCDAVMIGRALLGNPMLIKDVAHYLTTNEHVSQITLKQRFSLIKLHANKLCTLKGEKIAIKEMRGHAAWYVRGLPHAHVLKAALSKIDSIAQMEQILLAYEKKEN